MSQSVEVKVPDIGAAEHHVSQILSKIGARSRAEAAAFAASHRLDEMNESPEE